MLPLTAAHTVDVREVAGYGVRSAGVCGSCCGACFGDGAV